MGRRVIFGLDLRPYQRKYVFVKLGMHGVWDTPFGFELQDTIERTLQVEFLQVHPEEQPGYNERVLRMRAWLPRPQQRGNRRTIDTFWVSRQREQHIRRSVNDLFNRELNAYVLQENSVVRAVATMRDRYLIDEGELANESMEMRYHRDRWRRPHVTARAVEPVEFRAQ